MKKKQSLMSFPCFLLAFLLCLAMTFPAFAGIDGKSGELIVLRGLGDIIQGGDSYSIWEGGQGDGWSCRAPNPNETRAPELTLNNCVADMLYLSLQTETTIILASGSVNKVNFLSVFPHDSEARLTVKGNGRLIIEELAMYDYNDPNRTIENPWDFISVTDGATVTMAEDGFYESDGEFYEPDEDFYEPIPVIEETPQYDNAGNENSWNLSFTDVSPDAYYADAVKWAVAQGVTKGVSETNFAPADTCTRGQVATFLWRAKGCPEPQTTENPFEDVDPSSAFYKAILWAAESGITAGTSDTTFSPGNPCTRAHVVTFLWRSQGKPAASGAAPLADSFPQGYYTDAVRWADAAGLLNGTGEAFAPSALCPRADIVTYLYRVLT